MTVDKSKFNEIQEIPKGGLLNIQRANGGVLSFDDVEYIPSGGGLLIVERTFAFTPADPLVDQDVALFTAAQGDGVLAWTLFVRAQPSTGLGEILVGDGTDSSGYIETHYIPGYISIGVNTIQQTWGAFEGLDRHPVFYNGGEVVTLHYTTGKRDTVQQVFFNAGPPGSGTWTLALGAHTTAPLAFDISNAALQAALEALPNIGAGNVAVTDGPILSTTATITFVGALANTLIATLVPDSGTLDNGASAGANLVTPGSPGPTGDPLDVSIKFLIWEQKWA